jgi:hypothetical protein
LFSKKSRGQYAGEHRIGADDQAAKAGRYRLQPGPAEAEIERIVGDAENDKYDGVAPRQRPFLIA